MTPRIERVSARGRTRRLIGRVQSECLPEIEAQLEDAGHAQLWIWRK